MPIRRAIVLLVSLSGCSEEDATSTPTELRDQSGAVFGWECDDDICKLQRVDGTPALPDDCGPKLEPGYSYSWGFFIDISAVCSDPDEPGWVALPGWTRLVVCETDADCPVVVSQDRVTDYVCNAGLCKNAAGAEHFGALPGRHFMTELCLGHLPRFELEPFEPSPELAAAIAEACPAEDPFEPCVALPAGCPDPRG